MAARIATSRFTATPSTLTSSLRRERRSFFLNPPYDTDKVHGRLEQRFLERWTAALLPGEGVLMFLVPFYALQASAGFLSRHYRDIRAFRFPAPSFEAFRQCVLVARKRGAPVPDNPLDQKRIERWAADAGAMPELPEQAEPLLLVHAEGAGLKLEEISLDLPACSPDSGRGTRRALPASTAAFPT